MPIAMMRTMRCARCQKLFTELMGDAIPFPVVCSSCKREREKEREKERGEESQENDTQDSKLLTIFQKLFRK